MKESLSIGLLLNVQKISSFFTAPLLTVLVLVFVLFRNVIANFVIQTICKVLDIERYKINTKNRLLTLFIIMLGIDFLFKIWTKNPLILRRVNKATIIIGIFTLARIITHFINPEIMKTKKNYFNITEENFLLKKFIINVAKIGIYIIATFLTLTVLGININGLMAGLGIGSAVIALAVQDVFKNIIAGSTIIAEKPFIIGDYISLEGSQFSVETAGTVEDISLRSTTIRRLDNSLLNIPNSIIASNLVNNITTITNRRIEFNFKMPIYLTTDDLNRIKNKIKMVFSNDSKVISESLVIALNDISDEGYNFFIYCYINESRYVQFLQQQDKMLTDILDIMHSENIDFQNKNITVYHTPIEKNKKRTTTKKAEIIEEKKTKKEKNKIKIRNM